MRSPSNRSIAVTFTVALALIALSPPVPAGRARSRAEKRTPFHDAAQVGYTDRING